MTSSGLEMKALTLRQPWATLVAVGAKRIETRSWKVSHRGQLAIHAAVTKKGNEAMHREPFRSTLEAFQYRILPHGKIVAVCTLVDIMPAEDVRDVVGSRELAFGDFSTGRWAWLLEDVRQVMPGIRTKGRQGLWTWRQADLRQLLNGRLL